MRFYWGLLVSTVIIFSVGSSRLQAQFVEDNTVQNASQVLNEVMKIPAKGIPKALLSNAYGVAIVPGLIKGGFIVGARHGKGVLVTKDKQGVWQSPYFIKITGGSVGFQAGVQATDVILVFKSQRSVQGILNGKFTIGADASVAAGPIGRQAAAATDAQLKAEILSYSRSRGLFAGVAIDGAVLHTDERATNAYYYKNPKYAPGTVPPSALKLLGQIMEYTGSGQKPVIGPPPKTVVQANPIVSSPSGTPAKGPADVRQKLADASQRLQLIVSPEWKKYLALPSEVYTGQQPLAPKQLEPFLKRYDAVASDPRYKALAQHREFQETHALLRSIINASNSPPGGVLQLPPPPK